MAKKPLFFVQLDFNQFYREIESRSDSELCEWVRGFAKTLFFGQGSCQWAQQLRQEADRSREKFVAAGIAGAAARYRKNSDANCDANGDANGIATSDANGDATSHPNSRREQKRTEEKTNPITNVCATEKTALVATGSGLAPAKRKAPIEDRQKAFGDSLKPYLGKYSREMLLAFYSHWTEPNAARTQMLFEKKPTFEISRRLATWAQNESRFAGGRAQPKSFRQQEQEKAAANKAEIEAFLRSTGAIGAENVE